MSRMNAKAADVRDNSLPSVSLVDKLTLEVARFRSDEGQALMALATHDHAERAAHFARGGGKRIDKAYENYKPTITPNTDDEQLMKGFVTLWPKYQASAMATIRQAASGDVAGAMKAFDDEDERLRAPIVSVLAKDAEFNKSEGKRVANEGEATYDTGRMTLVISLIAAAIFGLGFGISLIATVVGPIQRTTKAMEGLASGDASVSVVGAERRDEVGALVRALDVFEQNLSRTKALERQSETIRADQERQRRDMMTELAEKFDRTVSVIVGEVTRSAGIFSPLPRY